MINALALRSRLPAERHPAQVYIASLSKGSRPTMRIALEIIAEILTTNTATALTLDWSALRFQHTQAIRTALAERYEPSTVNKMLSALRGVLRAAWQLQQMSTDDYTRAVAVNGVKGETLPAGRALTLGEIEQLMQACVTDESPAGLRDAAIIALLRAAGLRRAEICALRLSDYSASSESLTVRGKGRKQREVPIANGALDALMDWLVMRGGDPGSIFCPVNKGGKLAPHKRLSPQAIYKMLDKRAKQAGVYDLSPHDFRRTFASDLLDADVDISTVQRLMGHANVQTTQRYDRRGEGVKREAVKMLALPYHKRK